MGLLPGDVAAIAQVLTFTPGARTRALCLGVPVTHVSRNWIESDLVEYLDSVPLHPYRHPDLTLLSGLEPQGNVPYTLFLALWGIQDVECVDIDAYEGASIIADLNVDVISHDANEGFDLVIDAGTLEHCFNISNAMEYIHNALKPDGIVFHTSPANRMIDHGLFQISPTFYRDYYQAAKYEHLFGGLMRIAPPRRYTVQISRYTADLYRSLGGHHGTSRVPVLMTVYAAQKTPKSSSPKTFAQGYYSSLQGSDSPAPEYSYDAMLSDVIIRRRLYRSARRRLTKFRARTSQ
jgi:hypothetical protein